MDEDRAKLGGPGQGSPSKPITLGQKCFESRNAVKRYLDEAVQSYEASETVRDGVLASVVLDLWERGYKHVLPKHGSPQKVVARPNSHPKNFSVELETGKIVPISHSLRREANDRAARELTKELKQRQKNGTAF